MKTPTNNVYQLIHAMTAAEKRYFKRHYSSTKSITTELFDYLNGMDVYDEMLVKKHFSNSRIAKNLKVHKVQLSDLLLKSLTSYHNKKNLRSKIRIGLEEVEILMDKQIFEPAKTKLAKIKEACKSQQEFSYLPAIISLENQINKFFNLGKETPFSEDHDEEIYNCLDRIQNTFRLNKLCSTIGNIKHQHTPNSLSEQDQHFLKSFHIEEEKNYDNNKLSTIERYYINSTLADTNHLLYNDTRKELEFHRRNVQLFDSSEQFVRTQFYSYFVTLYKYLEACLRIKNEEEFYRGLEKLKLHVNTFPALEKNRLFISYLELNCIYHKKRFEEIITDHEGKIKAHIEKFSLENEPITLLNYKILAITNLALNRPKEIQYYLRRMHEIASGNGLKHYKKALVVLDLMSHFESKDYNLMSNIIAAQKRKIKKSEQPSIFFSECIQFFNNLTKRNENEQQQWAKDFIIQLREDHQKDKIFQLLKTFNFEVWLTSISEDATFSDWIKKGKVSL